MGVTTTGKKGQFMKKLFFIAALSMAGISANTQAYDLGLQGGLSGSFALIGHYALDKNMSVRGFYNARTVSGEGVSSIGAALEYDFQPNIYGALGLQVISLTGSVSGWSSGLASYVAAGYKDKLDKKLSWHAEINSFHSLAVGLTYKF
jgi:hypothetical protein